MPEPAPVVRQLIALRHGAGLSQNALAARIGTAQSAVSEIESGIVSPTIGTLTKWAAFFGMQLTLTAAAPTPAAEEPHPTPCPNGFHWIGQSFACCDQCGLPAWDHDGMAELDNQDNQANPWSSSFVLRPWKPGEREACQRKWAPKEPTDAE